MSLNTTFSYSRAHLYALPQDVGLTFGARSGLSAILRAMQTVLCRMLDMDFGEFTLHALG